MHRSWFLLITALCWMLAAAVPASAQYFGRNKVQYDDFDFRVLATDHFEIYHYDEEERATRDAARMAERWYQRHAQTFQHRFDEKKPIIFYANDADFKQTNVIQGPIGQGTGGVTESLKERVVMPLTGLYAETNHVLGHELVHSFQYDLVLNSPDSLNYSLDQIPLWLVEGMAEYLSVGRQDAHTAMWMRDAVLRDDLPTIEDMNSGAYFPYRYGQAYMAYLGGKYGDITVTNLFKGSARLGLDSALVALTGLTADSLSNEWIAAMKDTYAPLMEGRTPPEEAGEAVLAPDIDAGDINISPALSPDGRYVAFLSERDLFNINLFVADAQTGEVIASLGSVGRDPHMDAIRFIGSSGTWSPDGTRFAFVSFIEGDNEVSIWNVDEEEVERSIAVAGVTAIKNPAWSPDGSRIAFAGMDGGISDLYVLNLETNEVRQLTDDRYADLQPTWAPDGSQIAFVTDRGRGGTDFSTLNFAQPRLALLSLEDESIQTLRPMGEALYHNPQFAPDGRSLYFISDYGGFKDIYRANLRTQDIFRVTNLKTGVSGITDLSPAMTVAQQSGRMMFSVFSDNEYTVYALDAEDAQGTRLTQPTRPTAAAGVLPPTQMDGLVTNYLQSPRAGLPQPQTPYDTRDYNARLSLDYVAPPTIGVSAGGPFGSRVSGGVGFFFSDMLGNHNLSIVAVAQGRLKDIGGQVAYLNRDNRFNYGASAGHIPLVTGRAFVDVAEDPETGTVTRRVNRVIRRIYRDEINLNGAYPLSTTRRLEVSTGFVRYGFDYEVERFYLYPTGTRRATEDLDQAEPDPVYLSQTAAAFVGDYANFGFTSPVQGARYRLQVSPLLGSSNYVSVLADYRRYAFVKPFTFAVRGLHIGNYGAEGGDIFSSEFLGYPYYPGFVRGYSFRSLEPGECQSTASGDCATINRLQGTRIALASAEVRIPLFGTEQLGLIEFPYLPTELSLFTDAGLAWTADDAPTLAFERDTNERVPVVSSGVSARVNLLGSLVFEIFYAYPFQRPEKGAHFGFQIAPGW